uniref:Major sperm protein n=1 Tax=Meloidogyne hapla TaxID=6305 RepID=A0A1I8BYB1_MELHA
MQGDWGFRKLMSWLGCDGYIFSFNTKNTTTQRGICTCKLCENCTTRLFNEQGTSQQILSSTSVSRTNSRTDCSTEKIAGFNYVNEPIKFNKPIKLNFYPEQLKFNKGGGFRLIEITNLGEQLIAVKIKSTNKNLFFARPVFAFIKPRSTTFIHIYRTKSDSDRSEKIVIHAVEASHLDTDPANSFNSLLGEFGEQFNIPIEVD